MHPDASAPPPAGHGPPTPPLRVDLTVVDAAGPHDLAVIAPSGTSWSEIVERLPNHLASGQRWCRPDSSPPPPDLRLGAAGLRDGSVFGDGATPGAIERVRAIAGSPPHGCRIDVTGGPAAGIGRSLGREPVTIGRAEDCDLVVADPTVSRRHAELVLVPDSVRVRDLGSAVGTLVDGQPIGQVAVSAALDACIRMGDTTLRVTLRDPPPAAVSTAPDGGVLVSPRRRMPADATPPEIELPSPPAAGGGARLHWLAAAVPALGGVVLALAWHSAQFLIFALLSPLAMLGSAVVDHIRHKRESGRAWRDYRHDLTAARRAIEAALTAETATRRAASPDPAELAATALLPGIRLWERGQHDPDVLLARVGLGRQASAVRSRQGTSVRAAGTLDDVPVTVDLDRAPVHVTGPPDTARSLARWLLVQLTVLAAPDVVQVAFTLCPHSERAWRWARWLPHRVRPPALDPRAHAALARELRAKHPCSPTGSGPRTVVVDDRCPRCREPSTSADLAALLDDAASRGVSAILVDTAAVGPAAASAQRVRVSGDVGSRAQVDHVGRPGDEAVTDLVDDAWCERIARAISPLRVQAAGALPAQCTLADLLGLPAHDLGSGARAVRDRWRCASSADSLSAVIGVAGGSGAAAPGPISLDLVRDGPHALVAGTTGAGKSELLRCLVGALAAHYAPDDVGFVLVDYKGGAAFGECARLPHTLGVVTDLDEHLARRALASLDCELRRREHRFAEIGARAYSDYRARAGAGDEVLPRLVIVVDEFAELSTELGDFVAGLVAIARRGRSLGVHLVLATQRPAGVVSPEIRANTSIRVALRVTDPADSLDVVDIPDAATISTDRPGRAYLRLPGREPVAFQTATAGWRARRADTVRVVELDGWRRPAGPGSAESDGDDGSARDLVTLLGEASRHAHSRPGRRPWLEPLPRVVSLSDLDAHCPDGVPLGLVDLPKQQRQEPLTVGLGADRGTSLLLVGGAGSGRSTALASLALSATRRLPPERLHLHVLDHAGGALTSLARLPHCGSCVAGDITSSSRLLWLLCDEIARRREANGGRTTDPPAVLVMLDGWEQFLAAAEADDTPDAVESLLTLLRTGPAVGLTLALSGDRTALNPRLASAVATKLVLPLTDRADYALAGLSPRSVPVDPPPGRAVRAADAAEVQLAVPSGPIDTAVDTVAASWPAHAGSPAAPEPLRVRPLPDVVRFDDLLGGAADPASPGLLLGVGGDQAVPVRLDLHGNHGPIIVSGPHRTGRTTLLVSLLIQLRDRGRPVLVAADTRSALARAAASLGAEIVTPGDEPDTAGRAVDSLSATAPAVLLVDDAERFRDTAAGDTLDAVLNRRADIALVLATRPDDLAVAFRGLTARAREARCGVLLDPGPGDGAAFGIRIVRRRGVPRPGRGFVVGDPQWGEPFAAGPVPIQIALPLPVTSEHRPGLIG